MEKIVTHLGGTPTPFGITPDEITLSPHTMEMDPSDGKMEDDLHGLLGCVHWDTPETIRRNGRLALLCYHPDKARTAMEKDGVGITPDVETRIND
eukprot:7201624-Karenia_brevis.AAC.1